MNKRKLARLKQRNFELGNRIQIYIRPERELVEEIGSLQKKRKSEGLSREEEARLQVARKELVEYRRRNQASYTDARKRLFFGNARLISKRQKRLNPREEDYGDKKQVIAFSQWLTTKDFDPEEGKFSTKSGEDARCRLISWRHDQIRQVHGTVPRPILRLRTKIKEYVKDLERSLGYTATAEQAAEYVRQRFEEIGEKTEVHDYHITALRELESRIILDVQPSNGVYGNKRDDLSVSKLRDPQKAVEQSELVLKMLNLVDNGLLTDRERYCLKASTGIDDEEKKSYTQIGKELGIEKQRVKQIRDVALSKLILRMNPEILDSSEPAKALDSDNPEVLKHFSEHVRALGSYEFEVLRHFFGYYGEPKSFDEIGELYGKSVGSIKKTYDSAFKRVLDSLSKHKSFKFVY